MNREMTLNEYIKNYLNNDETLLFSNDYDYPKPFDDAEVRNKIAWLTRINYRSLIVDDMLTVENDGGDIARLFVKNGLSMQKRNIEKIYAIMEEDIPIFSNNYEEKHTKVYGEKNTTNITGARNTTSTDGEQNSTTTNKATSYDSTNLKTTNSVENHIDSVTNSSQTQQATDTSKQNTYTDTITIEKKGVLNENLPDYIFKELNACGFDYMKYFSKILADILTYPVFM